MIAVAAARLARTGASLDEVGALARGLVPRTHVLGALASLEYLRRSGRVGGGKARLASALRIRPIIEVREGRVEEAGWKRTRARALQALVDAVEAAGPLEALAVFHAEATDVDGFVSRLAPMAPGPVMVTDVGAVIGAHCGPGAIGVAYETGS
jgi:DegV family protein with EDD domain